MKQTVKRIFARYVSAVWRSVVHWVFYLFVDLGVSKQNQQHSLAVAKYIISFLGGDQQDRNIAT